MWCGFDLAHTATPQATLRDFDLAHTVRVLVGNSKNNTSQIFLFYFLQSMTMSTFGTVSKATLGQPLSDGVERVIIGFSERIHTIFTYTELN